MLYEGMLYEGTVPEVRKNTHVYNYSTRTILLRKYHIYTKSCYLFMYIPVFYFRMKVQRVYTVALRRYKVTYLHRYLQYKYKYTYFAA